MNLRVIPTGVHGTLDYLASGINLAFPRLLGLRDAPWAAIVPRIDGVAGASYSLLTDACAPDVRCRKGPLHGRVAMAVRIRQEGHPLLAAARADGHRRCAGRGNEQK
jgi:hypothetical protein